MWLNEELETYIDVSFRQSDINWYLPEGKGRFKFKEYPVKQCTQDDFG